MDGITFLNVVTVEEIQAHRDAWLQKIQAHQQTLQQLREEAVKLQQQADAIQHEIRALDGATQAADVFLKIATAKESVDSEKNEG